MRITLTDTATQGVFNWTLDQALASGTDYALLLRQGDSVYRSNPITIEGAVDVASASIVLPTQSVTAVQTTILFDSVITSYPSEISHSGWDPISTSTVQATNDRSINTIRQGTSTALLQSSSTAGPSQKSRLDTGAKVGISIGGALFVMLVALAAFLLGVYFRRKAPPMPFRTDPEIKPELDGTSILQCWPSELDAGIDKAEPRELLANERLAEMG